MATIFERSFPRGNIPIHVYGTTSDDSAAPIVLLFMDGFGPRPALDRIAERLVGEGYRAVIADLFYEHRPYIPLSPASIFSGGDDRQRLATMFGSFNQAKIDADIQALLTFCTEQFGSTAPIAATGYCMGGRFALSAATLSDRVVFAASFHGSKLAPENDDGPHLHFAGKSSRIYVGIAAMDPTFGAAEEGRLAAALREAGVNHVIETYAGAAHGFVMDDLPVFNAAASARHWLRLSTELREAFSAHSQAGNSR